MSTTSTVSPVPAVGPGARCAAAFSVLGAGLVLVALAHDRLSSPFALVLLLAGAAASVGWALLVLARDRAVLRRGARGTLLLTVLAWALGSATGAVTADVPGVALVVLWLTAAASLTGRTRSSPPRTSRPGRRLLALAAVAVAVGAVTTPALAATGAGDAAVPHGSHMMMGSSTVVERVTGIEPA